MDKEKDKKIKSFNNYYIMASSLEGASGGMMILWKKSLFTGTFLDANKHLMVVKLESYAQNNYWYILNVYVPNNENSKNKFWESLSKINSVDYDGRWLFFMDFNVPLYEHEKKGEMLVSWIGDWISWIL